MQLKRTAAIAATLLFVSPFAAAESSGVYLFGNLGSSSMDIGSEPGFTVDDSDSMYNFGVGYRVTENWAVEGGYANLGEAKISTDSPVTGTVYGSNFTIDGNITTDFTGFFFGARGDLPVSENVSVFARAGLFAWDSEFTFDGSVTYGGTSYTGSSNGDFDDGADPYVGIGAEWSLGERFGVNVQATRYMLDIEGSDLDIDTLSVGLSYQF